LFVTATLESRIDALEGFVKQADAAPAIEMSSLDTSEFDSIIDQYRYAEDVQHGQLRTNLDRRITRDIQYPLPVLKQYLDQADHATLQALAVALGYRDAADPVGSAQLLVSLGANRSERVRYRVARSVRRRAEHVACAGEEIDVFSQYLNNRMDEEHSQVVSAKLLEARRSLRRRARSLGLTV